MNLHQKEVYISASTRNSFCPVELSEDVCESAGSLPFTITRVEYLGSERFLYGLVEGAERQTKIVAMLPSLVTLPIDAGNIYDFVVDRKNLSYFDKKTERRIDPAFPLATRQWVDRQMATFSASRTIRQASKTPSAICSTTSAF